MSGLPCPWCRAVCSGKTMLMSVIHTCIKIISMNMVVVSCRLCRSGPCFVAVVMTVSKKNVAGNIMDMVSLTFLRRICDIQYLMDMTVSDRCRMGKLVVVTGKKSTDDSLVVYHKFTSKYEASFSVYSFSRVSGTIRIRGIVHKNYEFVFLRQLSRN